VTYLTEPLEQAGVVKMGPFISQKNGKTLMSASSFSTSLVKISKNNGLFASKANIVDPSLVSDGWYDVSLDLEDLPTSTGGHIVISIHVPGYLPVWKKFEVKQIIPIPKYTVTYDDNGATSGTPPVDSNEYEEGDEVTVLGQGDLLKAGEDFVNWDVQSTPTTDGWKKPGDTFIIGAANVTLYAGWGTAINATYDGNGNDSGTAPVDPLTYLLGNMYHVLGPGNLGLTGYLFSHWRESASSDDVPPVKPNEEQDARVGRVWYAKWGHTLTYDLNGADGGELIPTPQAFAVVPPGNSYYMHTAEIGSVYKTGYHAVKFNSQADGLGTDHSFGARFTMPDNDYTLYVIWEADAP
jgi:hypothetical protein